MSKQEVSWGILHFYGRFLRTHRQYRIIRKPAWSWFSDCHYIEVTAFCVYSA